MMAFATPRHWLFDVAETLSFISQPVLVGLAFWGLRQLWLTRTIAKISVDREARTVAIAKTIEYGDVICPLIEDFRVAYEEDKFPVLKSLRDKVSTQFVKGQGVAGFHLVLGDLLPKLLAEASNEDRLLLRLLNKFEGMAMWFCKGVADVEVAEKPIRFSYCVAMNSLLPFVIAHHEISNKTQFSNALYLYSRWVTEDIIKKTQKEIEERKQLAEIATVMPMKPHGTELLGDRKK